MRRSILATMVLTATLLAPLALAADNVTVPSQIDVNVHGNNGAGTSTQENTGFAGLSTTALVVLVVLAVLVIALIVALAGRNDYP